MTVASRTAGASMELFILSRIHAHGAATYSMLEA
jgi:hypothetical protein